VEGFEDDSAIPPVEKMMETRDLGVMGYRAAWAVRGGVRGAVVAGESGGEVLLVEHPAVITFGRRAEVSAAAIGEALPLHTFNK